MRFKNLPENIKKKPEQIAIEAFKQKWYMDAAETVILNMSSEEFVDFCISKLKQSKFRIYSMAIANLEYAVLQYRQSKNDMYLEQLQKTLTRTSASTIERIIFCLLNIRDIKLADATDVVYICLDIYESGFSMNADEAIKQIAVDLIVYKYKNENFGVLYGTT